MNKRRYFFFDIDGTLTDRSTGIIVPSALQAVQKLEQAGHYVSLCTGRAHYKADRFRKEHHFANMVCNGGHGIVKDGVLFENRPLDYSKAKSLYDEAIRLGFGVLAAVDDSSKVYSRDFKFYEQAGLRKEPTVYIIDENFDPDDFSAIYKLYISIPKSEEDRLTLKDTLGSLRFEPEYLMFQPDEKDKGIERMLELSGGNPEDAVVFGDDENDLVMFKDPFTKVAMGNACEPLKAKADYVALKNVEDGIYNICLEQSWFKPVD